MRILFVTLEFSSHAFSGNGVYSQSQVKGLSSLGHSVLVVSGRPKLPPSAGGELSGATSLLEIPLERWGRVDHGCCHEEFAQGCTALKERVAEFAPEIALFVDWSAREATNNALGSHQCPYVFMCYRVFLRSCQPSEADFYSRQESAAYQRADLTVVLCPSDAEYMQRHCQQPEGSLPEPEVLLPCLRPDMASLQPVESNSSQRCFLTCCVRLSPEKEVERFLEVVEALQGRGVLDDLQVTPLLCASASDRYAEGLKRRFRESVPRAVVNEQFLQAPQLADIFSQTLLNFHPPKTEAFGMTVVEAGSQGAPSVVNAGRGVGATELLKPAAGQILQLDYQQPSSKLAQQISGLLADRESLAVVGRMAALKSRSWTEEANASSLAKMLQGLVASGGGAKPA